MEQTAMVVSADGFKTFFFDHSFKSGLTHAKAYVSKNGGTLFIKNKSSYGKAWILYRGN